MKFRKSEYTPSQRLILMHLASVPSATVSKLSAEFGLSIPHTQVLCRQLFLFGKLTRVEVGSAHVYSAVSL